MARTPKAIAVMVWMLSATNVAEANGFYQGTPAEPYAVPGGEPDTVTPSQDSGQATVPDLENLPDQPPPPHRPLLDEVLQTDENTPEIRTLREAGSTNPLSPPLINVMGLQTTANPPDPVGDVGRQHYIQMLNATLYQVFDKRGQPLTTPRLLSGLWLGQPDTPGNRACSRNHGDPVVIYDHLADRWVMSQFAQSGEWSQGQFKSPFYLCVAVSQTDDPVVGGWYVYAFELPQFPDYPKLGLWPDGYYLSSVYNNRLYATVFERSRMLTGEPARSAQFELPALGAPGVRDTRMLPADLDGDPPLPGTPHYFVRTVDDRQDPARPIDRIELYAFRADFTRNLFSFKKHGELTVKNGLSPFDIMTCNRSGSEPANPRDCIPQPGPVGTLDALSNRPMMSLKFRRFDEGREFLVFNQTVNVQDGLRLSDGSPPLKEVAGIRWYQLGRQSRGRWQMAAQGTYAPQPAAVTRESSFIHRWMGSLAMDGAGNLALAYHLVNGDARVGRRLFPGIAYTGRLHQDPPERLTMPEQWIKRGTQLQWPANEASGLGQRWGDYSSLSVDPVDDCTFWYTQHLASGRGAYRKTRIASFRFEGCRKH